VHQQWRLGVVHIGGVVVGVGDGKLHSYFAGQALGVFLKRGKCTSADTRSLFRGWEIEDATQYPKGMRIFGLLRSKLTAQNRP